MHQARELEEEYEVVVHIFSFQVAPMAVSIGKMTWWINGG